MARLHEHQGKAILAKAGLAVPRGHVARSPEEAAKAATQLGGPSVVKIQAWTTGRAALGGVAFAETPQQAADHARRMLQIKVGNFPITELLVEERLQIAKEFFVSFSIDDRERQPVLLIDDQGGTGIEERGKTVKRIPCPIHDGPNPSEIDATIRDAVMTIFHAALSICKQT